MQRRTQGGFFFFVLIGFAFLLTAGRVLAGGVGQGTLPAIPFVTHSMAVSGNLQDWSEIPAVLRFRSGANCCPTSPVRPVHCLREIIVQAFIIKIEC